MDLNDDDISGQARNRSSTKVSTPQRTATNTMGIDNPYIANIIKTQPQVREALVGEPAVKEIKTVVREGTTITEEYERLNPDGSVTKAVSVGDRRDGMKHFGVYKMDKSGIVRRIDQEGPGRTPLSMRGPIESIPDDEWVDEMKKMIGEHKQREELRKQELAADKRDQYNLFADVPPVTNEISAEEKRQIVDNFKESLIKYGSKRLVKVLKRKLEGEKFNKKFSLSDEQKEELVKYGIRKLGKLLVSNLDDDRILRELKNRKWLSRYPSEGNESPEQTARQSTSRPVSFKFQPTGEEQENEEQLESLGSGSRPISFKIRPDKERKMSPSYDYLRDKERLVYPEEEYESEYKNKKSNRIETVEQLEESVTKTAKALRKLVKESDSKAEKQKKEEIIDRTVKEIMKVLSDSRDKYDESATKKEKRKRNGKDSRWSSEEDASMKFDDDDDDIDDDDYDDDNGDDGYDDDHDDDLLLEMDRKSLKKLLKKRYNGRKLKEECEPSRKRQLESREGAYARYQKDLEAEVRANESEETYRSAPEETEKYSQENKNKPQWDLSSLISQIFQTQTKKPEPEPAPPKTIEKKTINFDSLLAGLKDILSGKTETQEQSTLIEGENSSNNVYRARPQVEQKMKMEQPQPQREKTPYDFNSLVSTIKDCFKIGPENSAPQGKRTADSDTHFYQTRPLEQNRKTESSPGKERAFVDVDSILGRVHQAMAPKSSSGTTSAQQTSRPVSNTAYRIVRPQSGGRTIISPSPHNIRYENKSTSQDNTSGSRVRPENNSTSQVRPEKSSSSRQNGLNNDSISFTIRPQSHVKPQVESQHSQEYRVHNTAKPNSASDGSSPWWFSKSPETEFFSRTPVNGPATINSSIKGSVGEDLLGGSTFNTSFLNGNSTFSNPQLN